MARESRPGFKERLRARQLQIGCYVNLTSPDVVELLGRAGMDYLIIDLQHSSPDWLTLAHMIRAADAAGTSPLVRMHTTDPGIILKVLEMGAEGINLPSVKSADEVRAALDAIHYAPLGHRSACGHTRVGGYNSRRSDFPEHVKRQHERVTLWCQVEDPEALANVGSLADLRPGPDVIGVGRGDLSAAMGLYGQVNHPDVIAATEKVIAEVERRSGGLTASPVMVQRYEDIAPWMVRGCRLFTYGADITLLMEAARGAVDAFRAEAARRNGTNVAAR
jgi:4-hydroxy-2-oxoheptanedioate aldolase